MNKMLKNVNDKEVLKYLKSGGIKDIESLIQFVRDNAESHHEWKISCDKIDKINSKELKLYDENGLYHSTTGPAVIMQDGSQYFYHHGKLHNPNGPAVIRSDGYICYMIDGQYHRDGNFPAIVSKNSISYYKYGKLDRDPTLGPAIIFGSVTVEIIPGQCTTRPQYAGYYVDGVEIDYLTFIRDTMDLPQSSEF